jgi:hypothetical protein
VVLGLPARAARGDGAGRARRRGRRAAPRRARVARRSGRCRVRSALRRRGVGRADRGARVGGSHRWRRDARRLGGALGAVLPWPERLSAGSATPR